MGNRSVIAVLLVGAFVVGVMLWAQHNPSGQKALAAAMQMLGIDGEVVDSADEAGEIAKDAGTSSAEEHTAATALQDEGLVQGERERPAADAELDLAQAQGDVLAELMRLAERKHQNGGSQPRGEIDKAAKRPTAAPGPYAVFGLVTRADGSPAAGAQVTTREIFPGPSGHALPLLETTADKEGRYRFARMPEGVYELQAQLDGARGFRHLRFEAKRWAVSAELGGDWDGGSRRVELDIRLGATGDIGGRVVDAHGRAAAGVLVVPFCQQSGGEPRMHAAAASAKDGSFSCMGLQLGFYTLCAYAERGAFGSLQGVRTGDQATVQIANFGKVAGRVYDGVTDECIAGAKVDPIPIAAPDVRIFPLFRPTTTNAEGRYSLSLPGPGKYRLNVAAGDEYAIGDPDARLADVLPDQAVALDIPMYTGGSLTGVVRDVKGKPVSAATVHWFFWNPASGPQRETVLTDASGQFSVAPIMANETYRLTAEKSGVGISDLQLFKFVPGEPVRPVELKLGSGTLTGHVVNEEGNAIPDVQVRMRPDASWWSPHYEIEAISGHDGVFTFSGVAPGRYVFRTEVEGEQDSVYFDGTRCGPEAVIVLRRTSVEGNETISGHVRSEGGEVIAGAQVAAVHLEARSHSQARSGEDGAFTIEGLVAGPVRLYASADGYLQYYRESGVWAPAQNVEIVLEFKRMLRVRVVDAQTGQPIMGAQGRPCRPDGHRIQRLFSPLSGADGYLAVEAREPILCVEVRAEGYAHEFSDVVSLEGGQTPSITVHMRKATTITGLVLLAGTEEAVPSARVYAFKNANEGLNETRVASTRTDSTGEFTMRGLPQNETLLLRVQVLVGPHGREEAFAEVRTGPQPIHVTLYVEQPQLPQNGLDPSRDPFGMPGMQ